jgi:hypothetical protein
MEQNSPLDAPPPSPTIDNSSFIILLIIPIAGEEEMILPIEVLP